MSLLYLALGAAWMFAFIANWRSVMQLQYCITAVVALGMIEMSTWYFDYVNFNSTGFRPYGTTIGAVLISSARKTVSRSLVLVPRLHPSPWSGRRRHKIHARAARRVEGPTL